MGKLKVALEDISRPLVQALVQPSVFKQQYDALLATALATGELDDYHDDWYIDEDTGLLAVKLCLSVPRHPGLIVP